MSYAGHLMQLNLEELWALHLSEATVGTSPEQLARFEFEPSTVPTGLSEISKSKCPLRDLDGPRKAATVAGYTVEVRTSTRRL
jgi:hypothetical protein